MIDQRSLAGALTAFVSWAVGYFATLAIGQGLSAVSAYAVIVGWWLTAYISASFSLPVAAVVPLFVGYLALFLVATISGQSWFYRDVVSLTVPEALGIGLAQALAVCSPLLFDWLFRQAIRIGSRRR